MNCKQKKPNGETCKNLALKNDKYCYWHSKKIPDKEKTEARSKGGKQKIIKVSGGAFPEMKLNSIEDILRLNSMIINGTLKNEVDLRISTGIGYLLNIQMKGIELSNFEKRISAIEKQIKGYET
jgi:hypothetical protein